MKFSSYEPWLSVAAEGWGVSVDRAYTRFTTGRFTKGPQDHLVNAEHAWMEANRPYYQVWPKIVPPLLKLKLDQVDSVLAWVPEYPIEFRFSDKPYSALVAPAIYTRGTSTVTNQTDSPPGLYIIVSPNQIAPPPDPARANVLRGFAPQYVKVMESLVGRAVMRLPAVPGVSIEQQFSEYTLDSDRAHAFSDVTLFEVAKVVVSCLLIAAGQDKDLIEPDVLNADKGKYALNPDYKYVHKAHKRGKIGWNIGQSIEVNPHWVSAHLCLFHTGKHRLIPVIKMRKGSLRKRHIVEQLPTDFAE